MTQLAPLPNFVPPALQQAYRDTLNTIETIKAQRQKQAIAITASLRQAPFSWFNAADGAQILYEAASGLLWWVLDRNSTYSLQKGQQLAAEARCGELTGWRLPSRKEILAFAQRPNNPMRAGQATATSSSSRSNSGKSSNNPMRAGQGAGQAFRLADLVIRALNEPNANNPMRAGQAFRLYERCSWLCTSGRIDIDQNCFGVSPSDTGCLLLCNTAAAASPEALAELAYAHHWTLDAKPIELPAIPAIPDLKTLLKQLDYLSCRQPELEDAQFSDPHKGLWEAWGQPPATLEPFGIRPRNPVLDLRNGFVAIDFGTSSTVVAYDDNGSAKLLRIGVKDFWETQQPSHYENPTVLEFIDFPALLQAWQSCAYRPGVLWDYVRCSHEALHNWRNNESNPTVVSSILGKIKQWALRQDTDLRLRITDQKNAFEHELAPLAARNPVKGQALAVSGDDPFDPLELYAWFLGMNINWRGRGLFLRYYMSFPVDYPQAVKDNILAAFRRGLQRSLPETLIKQAEFQDFSVEERASEPAAYAAIALPTLALEPGADGGLAYAVFDFGGGTADFDYGYYRQPDPEEEDQGWEAVFERCGTAGDKFLGGENLLENLAYLTFKHNLEVCRQKKVAFTRPLDAADFPGSEMFLEKTRAAATNTLMLMARLRPLWETGQLADSGSGVQKLDLLTRESHKVSCELAIPQPQLRAYLEQRIEQGVMNFYAGLAKAFADQPPEQLHILLAGNASRSPIVLELFGLSNSPNDMADSPSQRVQAFLAEQFAGQPPQIVAHPPLPVDEQDVYRPTGKTGVALGLLRLCPGGVVKVVDHAHHNADHEAPFAYYVGRVRLGKFQPAIAQGAHYGEWHELGVARERVFNLYYSQSPLARTGTLKDGCQELTKRPLHLAGEQTGQKIYARPISPTQIELCSALSKEDAARGVSTNLQTLELR